jgi:hypothetical protein
MVKFSKLEISENIPKSRKSVALQQFLALNRRFLVLNYCGTKNQNLTIVKCCAKIVNRGPKLVQAPFTKTPELLCHKKCF